MLLYMRKSINIMKILMFISILINGIGLAILTTPFNHFKIINCIGITILMISWTFIFVYTMQMNTYN